MAGPGYADRAEIGRAARVLLGGGLVAIPTETVYGLAAVATDEAAVRRVFEAKGRPARNPLIVHIESVEMAQGAVASWTDEARRLADRFWPGPLTLVLRRGDSIPGVVTGGGDTVAVRMPDHPVALELIREVGLPLVAPSANLSGRVSPTRAEHVRASFPRVVVLEGGVCRAGIESTVVSLTGEPVVLRPGPIGAEALSVELGTRVRAGAEPGRGEMPSPGMLPSHYAPRAPVRLVASRDIGAAVGAHPGAVVIATSDVPGRVIRMPADARGYAAELYDALRKADDLSGEHGPILVELPEVGGADRSVWLAVLDRLERAAAPRSSDK